jgi:hypothetical protein
MKAVIWMSVAAAVTLIAFGAQAAEPKSCTEAYRACVKPDFGHCDRGCASTCKLRLEGCLTTGAFSTPGRLLSGLRRR